MKKFAIYILFLLQMGNGFAQKTDMMLLKAKVLIEQNNENQALPLLQNSLINNQKEDWIYTEIGKILCSSLNYKSALTYFLKADSLKKNCSSYYLARTYALLGEPQIAFAWLEKHLLGNKKKTELEINSDPAFGAMSQSAAWKKFWLKNWYTESEIEINAITALLIKGKKEEVENELEAYQGKILPKHVFYYLQAQLFNLQNLTEQAITSINQAIDKFSLSSEYLSFRAQLYCKTGNYQEALNNISKAIKIEPITPAFYLIRAEIARLAGNYPLAESDLNICKELFPSSEKVLHELALLEKVKGNYLNALLLYDSLIEKNTSRTDFYLERGNVALSVNQVEKADLDFGMALDLNPGLPDAYLNKGKTRQILQDNLGACYSWKKAKQLGNSEAAKLIYQNCKE